MPFNFINETKNYCYLRMLLSGTQRLSASEQRHWIPACAGTTKNSFFLHNQKQQLSTKTQGDTP